MSVVGGLVSGRGLVVEVVRWCVPVYVLIAIVSVSPVSAALSRCDLNTKPTFCQLIHFQVTQLTHFYVRKTASSLILRGHF